MKFINISILFAALVFGLLLCGVDAFFDWMYIYKGEEPFVTYIISDFPRQEVYWRGSFLLMSLFFGLFFSCYYNKRKDAQATLNSIFNSVIPICITNNNYDIVMANNSYYRVFGVPDRTDGTLKCYDHRPGTICQTESCPVQMVSGEGRASYTCEATKVEPNKPTRTYVVTATPFLDARGMQTGIIESFQDITARKELENEKEQLIGKLNNALVEVKKLSGFLPICATCKKIRDDKGYWKQIESYIAEHSGAEFSHSICPECAAKYYAKLSK